MAAVAPAVSVGSTAATPAADSTSTTCSAKPGRMAGANIGDLFGGLFGRGAAAAQPSRRGKDLETETELDFLEATKGVAMPLRLTSPASVHKLPRQRCPPGYQPEGLRHLQRIRCDQPKPGAFGFSEPCTDCRGSGSIIESPCTDCGGNGVTTRTRTINVRIPRVWRTVSESDWQARGGRPARCPIRRSLRHRARAPGQGVRPRRRRPHGDRSGELHRISIGNNAFRAPRWTVGGVKVPKGTADGCILRVRGRGVPKRPSGAGDLLVTVKVAVPPALEGQALEALRPMPRRKGPAVSTRGAGWAG